MNAGPALFSALITNAAIRFVIPVYQRAYSWDEENCEQLWDDILAVAQRPTGTHFTGSVVGVQDGIMSMSGVTKMLLIDGQQRVTTLTLIYIALARYAKAHPDAELAWSFEEIIDSGYLVSKYKKGEEHYRLTLSQGDSDTLRSLVDNLENPDVKIDASSQRLLDNLAFFEKRLEAYSNPNLVWAGLQRLEIVSISLDQGKDNPQLIFESMNSTGKDLCSADLIRNFVLMSQAVDDQESLYKNHWRIIETTLGADSYDKVFDDFVRNWLTVLYAPEVLTRRDIYPLFKRHVFDKGYDQPGQMVALLKELERFAGYYARITVGGDGGTDLGQRLERLRTLGVTAGNPLLLSFFDDQEQHAFSDEGLIELLDTLECYLVRRMVCGCATTGLNGFFASLIARLNKVQDDGGDYVEAFKAMLLNEVGTNRRFPTDVEFLEQIKVRDLYHMRRCLYVLGRLENSYYSKAPRDFAAGTYTIEHIMPQNALASDEWRAMLGDDCEEVHERLVHTLGNLTLTAYNAELSDASFADKKARTVGGYEKDYFNISQFLKKTDVWNAGTIYDRAADLAQRAVLVWPIPSMSDEIRLSYVPEKKGVSKRIAKFRDVFAAGYIPAGTKLVANSRAFPGEAVVTEEGLVKLENGETFESPSWAAKRHVALLGGAGARNGWGFWLVDGEPLDKCRRAFIAKKYGEQEGDNRSFRMSYWEGFYQYCSDRPDMVELFGDLAEREANRECWVSFGANVARCHLEAAVVRYRNVVQAYIYCRDAERYQVFLDNHDEVESMVADMPGDLRWDDVDMDKKLRVILVEREFDFDGADSWEEVYEWQADWLKRLRAVVRRFVK